MAESFAEIDAAYEAGSRFGPLGWLVAAWHYGLRSDDAEDDAWGANPPAAAGSD